MEAVHIGCQGWNYSDWVSGPASGSGVFYPQGTRPGEMLELYSRAFETVEIDSTFYAVPSSSTVDGWHKRTPSAFTFSLKLPQEITHQRGLESSVSTELLNGFCEQAGCLAEKLAVVLIQLPPQFEATPTNRSALRKFLPQLPADLRFSIEFRSPTWMGEAGLIDLLTEYNVAVALVEGQWISSDAMLQLAEKPTADFAYVRWMGARDLTRFDLLQRPQDGNLHRWSEAVTGLCNQRVAHTYAYFSNYYEGHAPASANKLKRLLGQPVVEAQAFENQPSLF